MRLQHKTLKNVSFFIRNVHQTKGNWKINGMCQRKKWFRFVFVCSASAKEWWMAAHKADSQCPQITLNYIRKERKNSKPFFLLVWLSLGFFCAVFQRYTFIFRRNSIARSPANLPRNEKGSPNARRSIFSLFSSFGGMFSEFSLLYLDPNLIKKTLANNHIFTNIRLNIPSTAQTRWIVQ